MNSAQNSGCGIFPAGRSRHKPSITEGMVVMIVRVVVVNTAVDVVSGSKTHSLVAELNSSFGKQERTSPTSRMQPTYKTLLPGYGRAAKNKPAQITLRMGSGVDVIGTDVLVETPGVVST